MFVLTCRVNVANHPALSIPFFPPRNTFVLSVVLPANLDSQGLVL